MKKAITLILLFGLALSMSAQQTEEFSIYFNVNEHTLDADDKSLLSKHLNFDGDTMFYHIKLKGHTDSDGDDQANYALSQRRLQSVQDFMISHGIPKKHISIAAYGEARPMSNKKSENRRVDVKMTFSTVLASNDNADGADDSKRNDPNSIDIANRVFGSDTSNAIDNSENSEGDGDIVDIVEGTENVFGLKENPNREIKKSVFVQKGGQIDYPSGTVISIPPNALVYADGSPVRGRAEILYTEFRDPVDIMFSGIPMTYDSAGTEYMMESGGMFDIQARQGDKEVFLAPGKQIDIDFVPTDDQRYNFYQTNDDGHWNNANELMDQGGSRRGFNTYMNIDMNGWKGHWDESPELVGYDPALAAIQTGHLFWKSSSSPVSLPTFQERWVSLNFAGVEEADLARSTNNREVFNISLNKPRVSTSSEIIINDYTGRNSELKAFKDQVFKVDDDEFIKDFKKRKSACDIRINYDKGRDVFILVLKYADGFKKTEAKILYPVNVSDKEAISQNQARFDLYSRLLASREGFFMAHLKLLEMRVGEPVTFEIEAFWHYSKQYMTDKEKLFSINEWLRHFHTNEKMMKRRYGKLYKRSSSDIRAMNKNPKVKAELDRSYKEGGKGMIKYTIDPYPNCADFEPGLLFLDYGNDTIYKATVELISYAMDTTKSDYVKEYWQGQLNKLVQTQDYKLRQSLAVTGFGVWNCDKLWQIDNKQLILATYEDDQGEKIEPVYMSMLFITRNASLTQNPYSFQYSKTTRSHIVLIDDDKNYYIISDEELRQSIKENSRKQKLVVKRINMTSPGDLKDALKI